jgi:hypothetical protein
MFACGCDAIGFAFRVAALWFKWEEFMPTGLPASLMQGLPERQSLQEKFKAGKVRTEE